MKKDEAIAAHSVFAAAPRHTLTSLQFQFQCLLTKLCIFTMCVCIHHCLVKILQWLLSAFAYRMQYCALICPSIMPTDLESADTAHFAVEASESHESGAFTPERSRGLTFCYYFRRRRFVLTYFGSRDCWGTEHQCKWNLLLPACWISRISRHMMQLGKKMTRCHILTAVSWMQSSFYVLFRSLSGLIIILYFLVVVFLERLLNRQPYISLNSWQQPAWFTYKTLHKPAQHCKWQWSHCDLSATLHLLDR